MGATDTLEKSIIFFDGVCNLCNSSVQFIIKRDHSNKFSFASLQSDFAKEVLTERNISTSLKSIILLHKDVVKTQSTAILTISRSLTGLWPLLYVFIIIPRPIRDIAYNLIARNRYKWFGKMDSCMMPSPELSGRFIE